VSISQTSAPRSEHGTRTTQPRAGTAANAAPAYLLSLSDKNKHLRGKPRSIINAFEKASQSIACGAELAPMGWALKPKDQSKGRHSVGFQLS
jgi:hypothetical protein